jgi:hypothetical protein
MRPVRWLVLVIAIAVASSAASAGVFGRVAAPRRPLPPRRPRTRGGLDQEASDAHPDHHHATTCNDHEGAHKEDGVVAQKARR